MLSTLLSALGSLGSSAINNKLMSNRADKEARMNLANAKDLANFQHTLALSDYALQRNDFIKDALLGDLRAVQSRQNAGLSTAFSHGFSPVQPLGGDVSGGYTQSFSPSNVATSLGVENPVSPQNLLVDAQIDNVKADTNKKNIDAGLTDMQRVDLENRIDYFKKSFDDNLTLLKENINTLRSGQHLNDGQYQKIMKEIDILSKQGNIMDYDLQHIKPAELHKINADALKALNDISVGKSQISLNRSIASLNKVKEHYASMGIGVGTSLIDSALAILASPNGDKLLPKVISNITSIFKQLDDTFNGSPNFDKRSGAYVFANLPVSYQNNVYDFVERMYKGDMAKFLSDFEKRLKAKPNAFSAQILMDMGVRLPKQH